MVVKKISKKALEVEEKLYDYEMVYIISPEVVEEKLDAAIDNVNQFITGKGGTVSEVERWGKRKLAYPIKHFIEGSYVLARFKMKPTTSRELEGKLQISDEVLRHLLIRLGS